MSGEAGPVVVTLSATYGAGGSWVAPRLAEMLGVPFVDRAIPTSVAERLAVPIQEVEQRDEREPGRLDRLLRSLSALGPMTGADVQVTIGDRSFAEATEEVLREHAATTGGVILGRAGAVVLAGHPGALHVRLTGPAERRLEQAMGLEGIDRATAEQRMRETDPAREAYVRSFYGRDPHDPALYHLGIDGTAIPLEACVALIADAVRARHGAAAAQPATASGSSPSSRSRAS